MSDQTPTDPQDVDVRRLTLNVSVHNLPTGEYWFGPDARAVVDFYDRALNGARDQHQQEIAQKDQHIGVLTQERDEAKAWAELLSRGKSPCGHWSAHAMTENGGKLITCLHCERDSFYTDKVVAEVRIVTLTQALERARAFLQLLGWSRTGGTDLRDQIDAALQGRETTDPQRGAPTNVEM